MKPASLAQETGRTILGAGWQKRSKELYRLAAEVTKKLNGK